MNEESRADKKSKSARLFREILIIDGVENI